MKLVRFYSILVISIILFNSCSNKVENNSNLPRSTPEAEGFSSQAIIDFVNAVENSHHEMHSFMIVRHGKVLAEGWWNPYSPELKHTMYSTSKSFTSTAVGFAVNEGLITVHDKLVSFFPEYLPDTVSENLADVEIQDLLTMSFGQQPEPPGSLIRSSDNWIKALLAVPVVNKPGSVFLYNSYATYLLSAIVQKVTGDKVIDYLKPRLFEPLGITGEDWEVDPMGINLGGWGLRIKTEDMAKFGLLYLQMGQWHGKQIIPEDWVVEATTAHIIQSPEVSDEDRAKSDWLQGYGYKFWRSRHNSYRGDGAYGQYILVLPEKDAVIAITSETSDMPGELNLVWDYLLPGFKPEALPANHDVYNQLKSKLASLKLRLPKVSEPEKIKSAFADKTYEFPDDSQIKSISFQFENNQCNAKMSFSNGNEATFKFGANQWIQDETNKPYNALAVESDELFLKFAPYKIAGAYGSPEENSIELVLRYIESPHTDFFLCKAEGDNLTVEFSNSRTQRKAVQSFVGEISK